MKNIGIISEYNPFHLGHAHQIEQSVAQTGADSVVAIMSGSFVQRGCPAIYDKWLRTQLALLSGANLVIELPVHYAVSSAEYFARGAIETLMATGVISHLSFGSEYSNLQELKAVASLLANEPSDFKDTLKKALAKGDSYPKARAQALSQRFGHQTIEAMSKSNSILALEYLKMLERYDVPFEPLLIQRVGSAYHDEGIHSDFPSATAIRKAILELKSPPSLSQLKEWMPSSNAAFLAKKKPYPVSIKDFEAYLIYRLKLLSRQELSEIREVTEGIENKLFDLSKKARNYQDLIEGLKHKRITQTKCQRLLLNVLLNHREKAYLPPEYIRVLGFDDKGRQVLSQMKDKAQLPIITTVSKAPPSVTASTLFRLDRRASNLYDMILPDEERCLGEPDFLKAPVIISKK